MKLLIVNSHLETGGIRQSLLNLLENINELDIEMDIDLQLMKFNSNSISKFNQLKNINIKPHIRMMTIYKTSFTEQKSFADKILKIFLWSLSKILGNKRVTDLIIDLVPRSKKNYDVAISYSNDIWASHVSGYSGGCNDYVIRKCNAKKKIAWIHNEPERLGLTHERCKNTYKEFNSIINVSYACQNMFDDIIPEYKKKSKVVYNMFNINRIRKLSVAMNPYKEDVLHFVTVARLDNQQKRLDRIINCCEGLLKAGMDNFQWHIVGDGPDRDMLNKLSNESGTSKVIIFEGWKTNPYPYMRHADCFVLASDYEAYGMVIKESLIVGTPVVSTKFPASSEVVENNKNGILVDIDDFAFYRKIKSIIQEPALITEMRKYINSHKITNEVALNQFLDVINDL